MKIYLDDNSNYIEIKKSKNELIDLSIRVNKEDKTSLIVTANLNIEAIDNIIATLITFKAESKNV
jgi:predicted transcriptional regulator